MEEWNLFYHAQEHSDHVPLLTEPGSSSRPIPGTSLRETLELVAVIDGAPDSICVEAHENTMGFDTSHLHMTLRWPGGAREIVAQEATLAELCAIVGFSAIHLHGAAPPGFDFPPDHPQFEEVRRAAAALALTRVTPTSADVLSSLEAAAVSVDTAFSAAVRRAEAKAAALQRRSPSAPPSEADRAAALHQRLEQYFTSIVGKPKSSSRIARLTAKYACREETLCAALERKYGIPVPAPESVDRRAAAREMLCREVALDQCSICVSFLYDAEARDAVDAEMTANEKVVRLPSCGHTYHLACLRPWLARASTCPSCRGSIAAVGVGATAAAAAAGELPAVFQV